MHHAFFRNLRTGIEDASRDIVRACRRLARAIAVMPWPAILACCIGLALAISVVPLALCLFILFMAAKIVIGAFVIDGRSDGRRSDGRRTVYTDYKD